jgi:hypothetical protein
MSTPEIRNVKSDAAAAAAVSSNAASSRINAFSQRSDSTVTNPRNSTVPAVTARRRMFKHSGSQYYKYSSRNVMSQPVPRLVKRDLQFNQSRNTLQIEMKDLSKFTYMLQREDWYHVFLRLPASQSITLLLVPWTLCLLLFAGIYMGVDRAYEGTDCGLTDSQSSYGTYFAFSLETCTTVGYGLPGATNAFFENCPVIQIVIYFQMVFSMLFNAFLFSFVFATISRSEARGSQVIFSKSAIFRRKELDADDEEEDEDEATLTPEERQAKQDQQPWIFQFRVTDVDAANPVVEAHVRVYAKKDSQMYHMRTIAPNDDLGGVLFLSWPNTIQHEVDINSPMFPALRKRKEKRFRLKNGGLNLRNADSYIGSVEQYCCPVCSECYGDMDRLRNHVKFNQLIESSDDIPVEASHQAYDVERDFLPPTQPTVAELKASFPDEIVCVVEGIDRIASGTFQALQSYTLEDVDFGGAFKECLFFSAHKTVMNLSQFHTVEGAGEEDDGDYDLGMILEHETSEKEDETP